MGLLHQQHASSPMTSRADHTYSTVTGAMGYHAHLIAVPTGQCSLPSTVILYVMFL